LTLEETKLNRNAYLQVQRIASRLRTAVEADPLD